MEYIDMTPTWEEIVHTLLFLRDRGDPTGAEFANAELVRMAKIADLWMQHSKSIKDTGGAELVQPASVEQVRTVNQGFKRT